MNSTPRISRELATFLESGVAIIAATRDGELQPEVTGAVAAEVHDDGSRLTLFVYEEAGREMVARLQAHPEIAIDFDLPTSHRACQVKGTYMSSRKAKAPERALVERQVEAFISDLEEIGVPRNMVTGWKGWPCLAVELRVTQLFEQTPGPGAGEPLR